MNQKALQRNEAMIRLACIVGACICFVIGLRFIYDDIAYHVNFEAALIFIGVPFLLIVFMAPRYKDGNIVVADREAAQGHERSFKTLAEQAGTANKSCASMCCCLTFIVGHISVIGSLMQVRKWGMLNMVCF